MMPSHEMYPLYATRSSAVSMQTVQHGEQVFSKGTVSVQSNKNQSQHVTLGIIFWIIAELFGHQGHLYGHFVPSGWGQTAVYVYDN